MLALFKIFDQFAQKCYYILSMTPKKSQKINILQKGNPVLREVSSVIPIDKIKSLGVKKVILDLKKAIESQKDAAAISAVQIGKPIRLFIISKRIFNIEGRENDPKTKDLVFINPKITKCSKDKQLLEEGCLSVRYVYGKVLRPEKITIEAYDENGKKFSRGFSELFSQIVQHENDHLNGVLFIDKAVDIQEITPEEYAEMLKTV
jgi:peptide deformylase